MSIKRFVPIGGKFAMKKTKLLALALTVMLTGCSEFLEELPEDDIGDESLVITDEQSSLACGTGLAAIEITALQDPDPDRQIFAQTDLRKADTRC